MSEPFQFEQIPPIRIEDWPFKFTETDWESYRRPGSGGAGTIDTRAFYTLYQDEDGNTFLQGGTVTGGNGGTVSIADEKVVDSISGPTNSAGTKLYVKASCEATVEDGLMMPGCKLNSASITTTGGSNATFTVASPTGDLYYEIGRWTADGFYPSGIGNLHASGCIGSFGISRT